MKWPVIVEIGERSFGTFVPDLPGCIAVGRSVKDVLIRIRGAIEFHVEKLL